MNVDSILLSEYARVDRNGRLTVVGVFNSIQGTQVPGRVPVMSISLVIHARADEGGTEHDLELRLINERRELVTDPWTERFRLAAGPPPPGVPLRQVIIRNLIALELPEFGAFAVEAYIDGIYSASASFYLAQKQP